MVNLRNPVRVRYCYGPPRINHKWMGFLTEELFIGALQREACFHAHFDYLQLGPPPGLPPEEYHII
jgi:hypothetical protein